MKLLLFFIFSTIEFFGIILLTFGLFRMSIKENLPQILMTSIVLTQSSYIFHDVIAIGAYAPFLQLIIFILFLNQLFRIHPFYSIIVGTLGYISFIFIQLGLVMLASWLHITTANEVASNEIHGDILQVTTSVIMCAIYFFFDKYRLGFTFIPDSYRRKIKLTGVNLGFLITTILASIIVAVVYTYSTSGTGHQISIFVAMLIIIMTLFYLSLKEGDLDD